MEKRKNKIQVMLTDQELKILDEIAAKRGLNRSALLRSLLLEAAQKSGSIGGGTTTPPHVVIGHWSEPGENDEIRAAKSPDRK